MPQPSVNYERFPSEYFSGTDIRVYFKDVLVDEITDLQFSMQEKVLPIFGYNSFTYDTVARGSRVVQGTFAINFKEADYLRSAIDKIAEEESPYYNLKTNYSNTESAVNAGFGDSETAKNELYGYLEKGWSTKFDEIATEYENAIWGGVQKDANTSYQNSAYFKSDEGSHKTFDILITYGPYKKDRLYTHESYGNKEEINYYENVNNGTIQSINNVQITGLSQVIDGSGQPIKEVYNFLAKDINRK